MENFDKPEGQTTSDNFLASEYEKDFLRAQSGWGAMNEQEIGYVEKKGFKTPQDLLKSYRELEKAYSSKVTLPKDGDKEAFDKLYSKLGMPQSADGFDIEFEPQDKEDGEKFKEVCLKNNILPESAKALYKWYQSNRLESLEKLEEERISNSHKLALEQQEEWGAKAQQNIELMKRGIRLFSDDAEVIDGMEKVLGTKQMMKTFARLGEAVSEDNSVAFGLKSKSQKTFSPVEYYREMFNDY